MKPTGNNIAAESGKDIIHLMPWKNISGIAWSIFRRNFWIKDKLSFSPILKSSGFLPVITCIPYVYILLSKLMSPLPQSAISSLSSHFTALEEAKVHSPLPLGQSRKTELFSPLIVS